MWLQAADFFVLPTLEEGCCNAIVEAMSAGLPVISSDKPFNYDVLDCDSAIMVDPMSVKEIRDAIKRLTESEELRNRLSNASIEKSKDLDIKQRAVKILDFLNQLTIEN